ncbi:MAG: hypothetical protein KC635_05260, partial [Myxococcales bacterium]|nr:hypothetical protein [Myxococcales bacterium]
MPANATTTFSASARDAAGNFSVCSNALTYTHDATAPATPAITGSTPASPNGTSTTPSLSGTAEAGATVRIYTSSGCTGAVAGSATAVAGGTFAGAAVTALANATTTFYAQATDAAGNVSGCSPGFAYTHDSQGPPTPVLTGTTPASPNNASTSPTVSGTITEAGLTIRLYKTADCSGSAAGTLAGAGTSFGVGATVARNTTTTFKAQATDGA